MDFKNKRIAVIGSGVEGLSSATYLASKGAAVTMLDKNKSGDENPPKNVSVKRGEDYLVNLDQYDMIVRSPGIKRNLPKLLEAEKKGVLVTSQIKLFFDLCPSEIIGVTGTKGKGTTSSLIYAMLQKSFGNAQDKQVFLGGNIGKPPFDFLESLTKESKVVLELSSFQLEDITKSPHIAVLLMVTSEHLGADTLGTQNYHETLDDYVSAKRNILKFQTANDFAILNRDYVATNESDIHTNANVFYVSRERAGEKGCFVKNGNIVIVSNGNEDIIISVKEILLPGGHNLENVCAAVMAAKLSGVSTKHIAQVLQTFQGLEHRLELVVEINGVTYYDDSFSTTPETAIAAVQAFKQPEVLILGGASKNSNFEELGSIIAKAGNIRAIIGIGLEWDRMKDEIMKHKNTIFMVEGARDMATIVAAASKIAQKGDVVLLSPACTSFDMFLNYKVRGEQFKEEVRKLQK